MKKESLTQLPESLSETVKAFKNLEVLQLQKRLTEDVPVNDQQLLPVMVFRLNAFWFALPVLFLKEILPVKEIHSIPKKTNTLLRGIVNINGELRLCISLRQFLELPAKTDVIHSTSLEQQSISTDQKMVLINYENDAWCFTVDQIGGIQRIDESEIEPNELFIMNTKSKLLKGVFKEGDKWVGLLDAELLFYDLKENLL